ncbi:hypothetical protein [Roseobacter sp. GAI101]|uniref:hypothetical protein n=1 Tax=Roseobacter sp. (strain GAI101) TaxID=391589 RepID=UPI00055BE411|nr:hypothetical protein [Roseobacter sp. GAI101]
MNFLRGGTPSTANYDPVARVYKNASGIDEIIHLHRCYWAYVDWLEATTDIKFINWVVHCDKNPSEGYTLSHLLMYWLWTDECDRFRAGLPTPNPYPPMGYEGWGN